MTRRMSQRSAEVFARQLPEAERADYIASVVPDAARSLGSRAANDADHAFMAWMRGQHQAAKLAGVLARMRHCGPPVRFVGRGLCEPIGTGPADFQGQLTRRYGSLSVAVEAKTHEGRLSWHDVLAHQRDDLDDCAAEGGVALLVYEHRDGSALRRFAVPWRDVPWTERSRTVVGRVQRSKTTGPDELAAWEVPARAFYLAPFVGEVRRAG